MKSQNNFTDQARQAMTQAGSEARDFRHEYIGTEHVLLALVEEGSGIGADVLRALGLTQEMVRAETEKLVHFGLAPVTAAELPLTPRALEAVEFARQEALYTCQGNIDTEHLLLGLLREPEGVAGVVLRSLGLSLEATREEVLKLRVLQMKIVERAVRPVLASNGRRMKMREELLAHLTEIYNDERAAHRDPIAATQAAARRFGDPAELSRDLQASVPRAERWEGQLDRWLGRRRAKSDRQYLGKLALQVFLVLAAMSVLCFGINVARFGWGASALIATGPIFVMNVFMPLLFLVLGLIYIEMRNTYFGVNGRRRSVMRLCWLVVAYVAAFTGAGFCLLAAPAWDWSIDLFGLLLLVGLGTFAALVTLIIARENGPNEIRNVYWTNLDLES